MVKSGTFGDFSAFEAGITHINGADARAFISKAEQYICVADAVKCVGKNENVSTHQQQHQESGGDCHRVLNARELKEKMPFRFQGMQYRCCPSVNL